MEFKQVSLSTHRDVLGACSCEDIKHITTVLLKTLYQLSQAGVNGLAVSVVIADVVTDSVVVDVVTAVEDSVVTTIGGQVPKIMLNKKMLQSLNMTSLTNC